MTACWSFPAPGQPARLPFWRGDSVGRPAELGAAVGAFTGELARLGQERVLRPLPGNGFRRLRDRQPVAAARRSAAGHRHRARATPRSLVERFRDELGDWRVILHSPYGLRVHGPLALAVSRRLRERYGIEEKPTASDDGIIVRLPDTDGRRARAPTCSCSTPTRSSPSSPPRWAARRCSPRGSANVPPAHCFCRAAIPASGRRCGISGSAPRSCSTSPASTRISRSCWRRCANACRTSTTCPR